MKEVTGLLVMDVDGTLIQQEGIDLLAQEAGVGQKVSRDYGTSNEWSWIVIFRGVSLIEGIRGLYLSENCRADGVTPGAKVLITELHQRGCWPCFRISWSHRSYREVQNWSVRANRLQTFWWPSDRECSERQTPERKKDSPDMGERKSYSTKSDDCDGRCQWSSHDWKQPESIASWPSQSSLSRVPYRIEKRDLSLVLEI